MDREHVRSIGEGFDFGLAAQTVTGGVWLGAKEG